MKHSQMLFHSFRVFLSGVILGGSLWSAPCSVMAISPGDMISHTGGVNYGTPSPGVSDININVDRAAINWNQFNIGAGEIANFNFSGSNGAVLNRVTGATPSQIHGMLNSNGTVFVVNPNGMVIGSSAQIQAKAFVGSTLGVADSQVSNFTNNGTVVFEGGTGVLKNEGYIHASNGSVVLLGSQVINSETGMIEAPNGAVELLSGSRVTATLADPSQPAFTVNTTFDVIGGTGITQAGNIEALSARLEAVGGNVYALAINNSGVVRANAVMNEGGRIKLVSHNGAIKNSGILNADLNATNAPAGSIEITGGKVELDNAVLAANGSATADNGITIKSTDDMTINASVLATTDANITLQSDKGIHLTTGNNAGSDNSTLINAYGEGDVSVTGKTLNLKADTADARVSVGSRLGTTRVKTTGGDLNIAASNGGFAQVGYHYNDTDARVANLGFDLSNGELYFGQGNIDVYSSGNILISNTNNVGNLVNNAYAPAAMIGHSLLPNSETLLLKYPGELESNNAGTNLYTGGDIRVTAMGNINMSSSGNAVSQIGHYVQGNMTWNSWNINDKTYVEPRFVRGHVDVDSYGSVSLVANNGGLTSIGHTGDYMVSDTYGPDSYYYRTTVTASKDVTLTAGSNSLAQIGLTLLGGDLPLRERSNLLTGNVLVVAGENVSLTGAGETIIGHKNAVTPGLYHSTVIVGYSMNRISEITDQNIVHQIEGALATCLADLKARFNGQNEGVLSVGENARIGREYMSQPTADAVANFTGIFGWRLKRDNASSAIHLADGAVLAGLQIDSSSTPGQYNNDNRYNIGEYPGDNALGFSYAFEDYGYTLGDYCAGTLPQDVEKGSLPSINSGYSSGKLNDVNLGIFYPVIPPSPTPTEKPRIYWPMIPVWFEECCVCCCCCVQTTCDEYTPGPCEPVTEGCESDSSEPTLAPLQEQPVS